MIAWPTCVCVKLTFESNDRVKERACQPCFNGDVHVKLNFRVTTHKMKIAC